MIFRQCFVRCEDSNSKKSFIPHLNNSFGSGGMSSSFNEAQFSLFIQFLKRQTRDVSVKKAISCIGQQACGNVWVMGPNLQIDENGDIIEDSQHTYVWMEPCSEGDLCIPITELIPTISRPFSTNAIHRIVPLLRIALKHNFQSSLSVLAGDIMALHYQTMTKMCKGCPAIVAIGPPETGKSTALAVALAISGKVAKGQL